MRRLRPDPVMGDVVRARLDALVAEISPRHDDADADEGADADAGLAPQPDAALRPAATTSGAALVARAWEFGRAHVAVIGVIGLLGVIAAVWSLTQTRTVPVAVAAPTPVPASVTPTPTPVPEPWRVHVLGAVASPGVVSLPPGARVEDAIAAAGGMTDAARPGELNLAAVVADGVQVDVGDAREPGGEVRAGGGAGGSAGVAGGAGGAGSPGGAGSQLDLNAATPEQLDGLPGVGPVTAQAILAWRTEHKRFTRVEELQEIDGIGPKTYGQIAPHVRV